MKSFKSQEDLELHQIFVKPQLVKCSHRNCKLFFENYNSLTEHMCKFHRGEPIIISTQCVVIIDRMETIKPPQCSRPQFSLAEQALPLKHKLKPYPAKYCVDLFSRNRYQQHHHHHHHQQQQQTTGNCEKDTYKSPSQMMPPLCDESTFLFDYTVQAKRQDDLIHFNDMLSLMECLEDATTSINHLKYWSEVFTNAKHCLVSMEPATYAMLRTVLILYDTIEKLIPRELERTAYAYYIQTHSHKSHVSVDSNPFKSPILPSGGTTQKNSLPFGGTQGSLYQHVF
jgi:hypothetical protein